MAHLSNRLTNILTKPVRLWQFMLLPEEFTTDSNSWFPLTFQTAYSKARWKAMVIRYLLVSEHSEQEIHKDKCLTTHT